MIILNVMIYFSRSRFQYGCDISNFMIYFSGSRFQYGCDIIKFGDSTRDELDADVAPDR